ncbi:thioredoxin-related transmembrane protein 2 homolog [Haliotis asinina]|uniref:thioredoxin-related transmembrane protein 2 homolog n=1 Tax=Haliotis asinina TaxID=109174 RepID=UPI0035320CEC
MALLGDWKAVVNAHYISNILLAVLYFILKTTPTVCTFLFEDCKLEIKEWEWITFLGCVIVLKNRKEATINKYVSTTCLFAKMLNVVMFFKQSPGLGIAYCVLCLLQFIFLPEPTYQGPEHVIYFRGPHLEEELEKDTRVRWFITFYAAWSPNCMQFAPSFSEVSAEYSLNNLKFGKIDVSRYPAVAEKFKIDHSAWSRQLPTIIFFEDGKEKTRRPLCTKHHTLKFALTKENFVKEFELNDVYDQCKKNPLVLRKKKDD